VGATSVRALGTAERNLTDALARAAGELEEAAYQECIDRGITRSKLVPLATPRFLRPKHRSQTHSPQRRRSQPGEAAVSLSARQVTVRFGALAALNGVDFEVERG